MQDFFEDYSQRQEARKLEIFQCLVCSKKFGTREEFDRHLEEELNKTFKL